MCGLRGAVGSAVGCRGPLRCAAQDEPRELEQVVRLVAADLNGVECGERRTEV